MAKIMYFLATTAMSRKMKICIGYLRNIRNIPKNITPKHGVKKNPVTLKRMINISTEKAKIFFIVFFISIILVLLIYNIFYNYCHICRQNINN